ncbi:MAG: RHS repeat-associated core domain-containing protein [Pyrinomonadaceae bacterium]
MKNTRRLTVENSYGIEIHTDKRRPVKPEKNIRKTGFRYRFAQILCAVLMTSILANSTPAAPQTIAVSLGEINQDIRFSLLSNDFGAILGNWASSFLLFFSSKKLQSSQISRIEIRPGRNLTIRQGEPVNFTATAYTAQGIVIGGLKFDWTARDVGRNRNERNLANGIFSAHAPGNFVVTAKTGGYQAQVNITVEENKALNILKKIKDDEANGINLDKIKKLKDKKIYKTKTISSKEDYKDENKEEKSVEEYYQSDTTPEEKVKGPNAGSLDAEYKSSSKTSLPSTMMRPIDEDGWNNDNWWMADDPGNGIGNPPGTSPDAGAGNGNFQFSAPVIALPGRGIDLNLSLNYNSRVWSKSGSQMIFDSERGFPAPGWSLGFGKIMFMGTSGGCMMIDADGTNHGYTGTLSNYSYGNYSSTSFNGHTTDGTFIDYSCYVSTYNGVTSMSASASLPNGIQIQYYVNSVNGKQAFPTQVTDAQGNYITVYYRNNRGAEIQTVTDTLGRVITFNYDSSNRLISVTAPKMDNAGTRTVVRLHYKQIALSPGFAYGITTDTNNSYPYVVDAIYYPGTNTGYWFNDNDSYSSYGMIAKVIEQRGMSWSGAEGDQGTVTAGTMSKQAVYNYPLSPDYTLTDAPTYSTLTESWAGMDTAPAVTSYDIHTNSTPRTITVTQPNGVKSKQYSYNYSSLPDNDPDKFKDGLVYQDETLDAANNQLSKSVVTWEQGAYDSPRPAQTEITDEKLQVLKTTYTYGANYNQLTSQKQYDYDGVTLLKEARNSYENSSSYTGRHIFNLVKTAEIFDGTGNRAARTDYEYDNNAVVNGTQNPNLKETSGVTMHLSSYDPYTTDTQNGNCIQWAYGDPYDPYGSQYCVEYEQVSVYDSNTVFRGNLTKTTGYADAANLTNTIAQTKQYDVTGNLTAESASCCELKTYDYNINTQFAYPTTQTRGSSDPNSPIRNTGSAVYDFYTGLVKQATDANGRTSSTTYNSDTLRPITSTSSTGAYSQTTYDEAAMKITDEVHEANGNLAGKSIKYLNGIGQVKKEEALGVNNVWDTVETKYNNLGQLWKQSRPYRAGETVQWSETIYDIQGRTRQAIEPDGSYSQAFYNEAARPDAVSNSPGNSVRVVDAWGRERWGRYDAQGRLAEVVEPNPNGNGSVLATGSLVTKYTYNTLGNLTETEQGVQLRKFKYDSLGRLTRQKLAEQTATLNDAGNYIGANQPGANWSDAFIYDERSNVTQKTDARGVKTNYVYGDPNTGASDPLNRLRLLYYDLSGAHDTSNPIYAGFNVTYDYETGGDQDRIRKIEAAGLEKEEYTYYPDGKVQDYTQTVAYRESYLMTTSYIYDTLNRVTDIRYPAQYGLAGSPRKLVQQTYDGASRLSTLKYNGSQQAGDIIYNAADQTTSINIGTAGANQVNENYTFDPQTGLLTNQKVQRGSQTLLDLSYDYNRNNSVGNLNGKTGHLTKILNNLDHTKDRSYEYDALGRLTKAKGGATNIWQQSYSYDRYGNRTSVAATGVAADNSAIPSDGIANLAYDANTNRITTSNQSGQYEYDAAGNQIRAQAADGTWLKFEYDTANQVRVIKRDDGTAVQGFLYGATGSRLMNHDQITGEFIIYANLGGTTLAEYVEYTSAVPTWTKSYTYLGDSQLATITPNGQGGETINFNHPDRLGTRTITNQQLGTNYEQAHLPFGTALNAETSMPLTTNKKRFTSYDRSAVTGLDYAVNRTYDSKQGRFTQVDPIGMAASSLASPQTLNLYAYCGNDPINHTDPSGLFWGFFKKLFKWVLVAVAVIVAVVTIVGVLAAPATIAGILGAISAGANAASQVLNAAGFKKIGRIFGIIAAATGFGSIIAGKIGAQHLLAGEGKDKTFGSGVWFAALGWVGAIANSFAHNDRKKQNDEQNLAIIRQTIADTIKRLKNNSKCLKTIQDMSSENPIDVLQKVPKVHLPNQTAVAVAPVGARSKGFITLGDKFFTQSVGGWTRETGMNSQRTRQFTILHELLHLSGSDHTNIEELDKHTDKILKDCFGVTAQR